MPPSVSLKALLRIAYASRLDVDLELTQDALAARSGVDQANISRALSPMHGEARPETVARILRALGYSLALVDEGYEPVAKSDAVVKVAK